MRQYNIFISTFFLAFTILFSSCTQFYIDEENFEENLRVKATEIVSNINPDLITAEFFETLELMIENDFHKQNSKEKAVFFNNLNRVETFNSSDIERFESNINEINKIQDDQDELYKFAIENSAIDISSEVMKLQIKELFELGNTDDSKRIASLQNWSNNIKVNNDLTKEEKQNLLVLESSMISFSQISDQIASFSFDKNEKRGDCMDCIKDNKKKIFGWGAVIAIVLATLCIIATVGTLAWQCILGWFTLAIADRIIQYCGDVCF